MSAKTAMSTAEIYKALVKAGVDEGVADAMAKQYAQTGANTGFEQSINILKQTMFFGFGLLLAVCGWILFESNQTEATLQASIQANRQEIIELHDDVAELKVDVAVLKTDVAALKTDVAEIKHLLDERLPPRR